MSHLLCRRILCSTLLKCQQDNMVAYISLKMQISALLVGWTVLQEMGHNHWGTLGTPMQKLVEINSLSDVLTC